MEIANAVAYLHFGFPRPIVFKEIKPSHILLVEQNFAKLYDQTQSESISEGETHTYGENLNMTMGFIAPKYHQTLGHNEKCGAYSFGTLLLELWTGQTIYNLLCLPAEGDDCAVSDYVKEHYDNRTFNEILDPIIIGEGSYAGKEQQMQAFIELIFRYVNESAEDRPTMIDAAKQLREMYLTAQLNASVYDHH